MLSHFEIIKEKVDLVETIEKLTNLSVISSGKDTLELEDKTCPYCGHKDCFKINIGVDVPYYNCFSCREAGDVVQFTQTTLNLKKPYDAVKHLASMFNVELPESKLSPQQQILNAAADYYHNLFVSNREKFDYLSGMSPMEYQEKVRRHSPDVLKDLYIGWSDGKVVAYLESVGFDIEVIKQSGLYNVKTKGDFLPAGSFIYPHMVRNKASSFTFKNMAKGLAYQFRKDNRLNNVMFYNQDDVDKHEEIVIVEGENDLISVKEGGWEGGVIATIGQLSSEQIDWLSKTLPGRTLVTCFDSDDAGDKYRDKLAALSIGTNIKIDHIKVPVQYKDIDKYLKDKEVSFETALKDNIVHVMGGVELRDGIVKFDGINVFERDNAYYKVVVKNNEPDHVQISDFVMNLKHILVIHGERHRVVNVTRIDGLKSKDIVIDSETKTTLRMFKKKIAAVIDGFYYGSEKDMEEMWRHVMSKDGEFLVDIPAEVGRLRMQEWQGSWIFKNCFIDQRGNIHLPDEQGVFWPRGKKGHGIRPQSISALSAMDTSDDGIPSLKILEEQDDYDQAVKFFLENLVANFGSQVQAITTAGWCMANAFSDPIFSNYGFFPFLFIWGKFGGGKSGILKILLSIYNMEEEGMTTVSSLSSGVGFERKMAYYCSLPMALDEVRSDKETRDNYSNFRKWFNRQGRSMGSRDNSDKIQQRDVKSNIIFGGEEVIEESATRSRIIPIRLAKMEDPSRETRQTYINFMSAIKSGDMSAIGLNWIQMACEINYEDLFDKIDTIKTRLRELCPGVKTRTIDMYSIVGFFGFYLSKKYYPDYDYLQELSTIVEEDKEDQDTSDIVSKFFDTVDGLISSKEKGITKHHISVKDNSILCVWFQDLYRIANQTLRQLSDGNTISINAIRKAIREEAYYIDEKKVDVGMGSEFRRRCILIDLNKAPENIRNLSKAASTLEN